MNCRDHVDEEISWMTSSTQANHQFPSHKHVTNPTIDSNGRSFLARVTLSSLKVCEAE